ncbi:conserved hypothetical protein [Nitrosococcus halophilus Nc 4]|uniref:DUF4258 domain-containing protein n=1 Tax=Nitrosococcus halophilus (strain Nc4) TaxID=472759 RepID=D5BWQ5_NITHN|nr:DUF4258 domain-containing protein [Nitrosococcus halophilus]ADE13786.1 conserved hypothetical protein [Nitrosococcus halophilus Nc 4]
MSNKNKIAQLQLSDKRAREIIREAVLDTSRIQWSKHARKRMRERRITTRQVLDVLSKGKIIEGPVRGTTGDWECTLERFVAGDNVVVVVAIETDSAGQPVIIVTTYHHR